MTEIPAGAERSPDGNYWWDGSAWQLIPENERGPAAGASAASSSPAAGAGGQQSDDPLQDEQVRQALTDQYPEVAEYAEPHGAELETEPEESEA
jgi:hypothetical protein